MSTLASYGSGVRMVATGSGKAVPHPVPSLLVRHAGPSLAAVQTTTTGHHNSSYPHVQHQYASWSSTLYALLFGSHQGAILCLKQRHLTKEKLPPLYPGSTYSTPLA
jgi:hypothetical protein